MVAIVISGMVAIVISGMVAIVISGMVAIVCHSNELAHLSSYTNGCYSQQQLLHDMVWF